MKKKHNVSCCKELMVQRYKSGKIRMYTFENTFNVKTKTIFENSKSLYKSGS